MLRAIQLGLSLADLDLLTVGMLIDMHTEAINDQADDDEYEEAEREATQDDFDRF